MKLAVGDPAPDLQLLDSEGVRQRLSDLWSGHPLYLLFVRHFG